jgi:hypothetical protein
VKLCTLLQLGPLSGSRRKKKLIFSRGEGMELALLAGTRGGIVAGTEDRGKPRVYLPECPGGGNHHPHPGAFKRSRLYIL